MEDSTRYQVGFAVADITPPIGTYLAGFANRTEPSTGTYHRLSATVVAIDDGDTPLLIVGAEILGFYTLTGRVRAAIHGATGVPTTHILLNGSHTHCGPNVCAVHGWHVGEVDEEYVSSLVDKLAASAAAALQDRRAARLRAGFGRCTIGVSRRRPDGAGGVEWNPSPASPRDPEVAVLQIESPSGDLRGVVFSYGCHPTSSAGLQIGGDYVGFALDRIAQRNPGIHACFLQGCGGDQKTRPADPQSDTFVPRDVEQIRQIGQELGDAVCQALESPDLRPLSEPLSVRQTTIELALEPADAAKVQAGLADERGFLQAWARHLTAQAEQGVPAETRVPFEIQTVRFGRQLAVVALSGEMTAEHGLRLKRDLTSTHFDAVFPVGYANSIAGYIPVRRQIPEGGYEVLFANQWWLRPGPFVEATEDLIHDAVHASLMPNTE